MMSFYDNCKIVIVVFSKKNVWAFFPTNPQLFLRCSNAMLKNRSCAAFFYKICMIMGLLMCLIRLTYYRFGFGLYFLFWEAEVSLRCYEMEIEFSCNILLMTKIHNTLINPLIFYEFLFAVEWKCIYCII